MSAAGVLGAVLPEPAAGVLSTAIETARNLAGCLLPAGKRLAFIARHFIEVWGPQVKGPKTLSQKARQRDGGRRGPRLQPRRHARPPRPAARPWWAGRALDALRWELAGLPWTGGTVG